LDYQETARKVGMTSVWEKADHPTLDLEKMLRMGVTLSWEQVRRMGKAYELMKVRMMGGLK
jgi:hypothetical protein